MATKHTATDSRGQVHKRTSQNRVYSHAVIAHWPAFTRPNGAIWQARSSAQWAGNEHLARQYAADCQRRGAEAVEVIPAVIS